MTIQGFITARLDEWEQAAREATPGPWVHGHDHWADEVLGVDGASIGLGSEGETATYDPPDAAHIAMHDPATTLALVASLRAVVEAHACAGTFINAAGQVVPICMTCEDDFDAWPCPTVRHIASAWRGHPDFDEEWLS